MGLNSNKVFQIQSRLENINATDSIRVSPQSGRLQQCLGQQLHSALSKASAVGLKRQEPQDRNPKFHLRVGSRSNVWEPAIVEGLDRALRNGAEPNN